MNCFSTASRSWLRSLPPIALRTETRTSMPVFTSTPSFNGHVDFARGLDLIRQYPRSKSRNAVQPVRQESKRTLASLRNDARDSGFLGKYSKRQEDFKDSFLSLGAFSTSGFGFGSDFVFGSDVALDLESAATFGAAPSTGLATGSALADGLSGRAFVFASSIAPII